MTSKKIIPIADSGLVKSWSFSRYSDYRQCPLKFKLKHLDKIKEPPNDAMARGQRVHDHAANFIKGKLAKLPTELKAYAAEFKKLRALMKKVSAGVVVEEDWAFTKDWTQTTWNDWAHCWVRIKLDCAFRTDDVTLRIKDWKTGKFRGANSDKTQEYLEQLELYVLAAFLLMPFLETVIPSLEFVDADEQYPPEPLIFTRADVPRLQKLWAARVAPMFADKQFAPRPNSLCRFCHYRAANAPALPGGKALCKY